jgi:hypothetical protein
MQKQVRFRVGIGLAGIVVVAVAGCGGKAPSAVRPMEIASDAGSQAVAKYDTNKDGQLDYKELEKAPGLRAGIGTIKKIAVFRRPPPPLSQIQGAKITAEEIDARIQAWIARGVGRISVPCRVFRKRGGRSEPIADAQVKFVPEGILGPGLTAGTGTTDKSGSALVSQPSRGGDDPANGMSPGFYRVEITKGNEIPAKYNSATTLGQEVASDAPGLSSGVIFELEY